MTTDASKSSTKLIKDLKSIPSPVFYIFAAVALFSSFYVCGFTLTGVFAALLLLLLVACACADINAGIVPDLLVIAIAVLGVAYFLAVEGFTVQGLISRLIGAVCISLPMLIVALLVKGAFGGGDIKLMAAAGIYLGWRLTVVGAFLGLFISGFYAIYLLLLHKAGSKSKVKLVPFLAIGIGIATLFGSEVLYLLTNGL